MDLGRPRGARDGELQRQGGTADAVHPPEREQSRGHRRPGRPGAGQGVRAPLGDVSRDADDRGRGRGPAPGPRRGGGGVVGAGRDHLDRVDAVQPREPLRVAEDADGDPGPRRRTRAGDDRLGPPLGPPAVESDPCHRGPTSPSGPASRARRSPARSPRARRRSRTRGRPGAGGGGCDIAGTRSAVVWTACGSRAVCHGAERRFSSWGRPRERRMVATAARAALPTWGPARADGREPRHR